MKKQEEAGITCPECGSEEIMVDSIKGEKICAKCGLILNDGMIDTQQDWRAFDSEDLEKSARTGAPLTRMRHDRGIGTEIGKSQAELFKVSAGKRGQYFRIKQWQKRLVSSKDRNFGYALAELERIASALNLPRNLQEEVSSMYEKALEEGLVKGRSIEAVIGSLVYALSREYGTPRLMNEICAVSGVDKRDLGRTYRYVARKLGLRILPAKAIAYVPRCATILKLDDKTQVTAKQYLNKLNLQEDISGKGPIGVAAAALYIAAIMNDQFLPQRKIADAIGVTEVTIRNRCKDIAKTLGLDETIEKKLREMDLAEKEAQRQ
jgi:transcription initiation factor TFIIB